MSQNASLGQMDYFLTPWGMQCEIVSFPDGKAYKKNADVILWHPPGRQTEDYAPPLPLRIKHGIATAVIDGLCDAVPQVKSALNLCRLP